MPTISVIVPVYRVEKYIHRCVDSILGQSFTDFELILVDDGSPDGCPAICNEYAAKDNRVVVIHQENGGLSAARNAGIDWAFANSDSQWLTFIDSDDWVNKTYLEALLQAAVKEKCLISICNFLSTGKEIIPENIEPSQTRRISSPDFYNENFYTAQSACCKLFKKSLFVESRYRFQEGILYEDSAIIYQILFSQRYIALTTDAIYFYFKREESITNADWHPKRMVYCQVQRNQMQWLMDHGYEECVKTCLCHYLGTLHYNASLIQNVSEYRKYVRTMRKICREMLSKYAKQYDLSIGKYPQFYEAGYPRLMAIYWVIKAQADKLKARRRIS